MFNKLNNLHGLCMKGLINCIQVDDNNLQTSPKKAKEHVDEIEKSSTALQNPPAATQAGAAAVSAKLKKLEKSSSGVVVNFGASWLPVLEKEFEKPEFKKV